MKPAKTKETVRPRWCDPLCTDPLRHDGKCEIKKLEAGSEVCIECDDVPCSCLPEAASEVLTRNEHSVMVADFHNAFCAGSYDRLVAHDDALRAALKKAEQLLAEAGGWAKYEGFYRLGNRINEALGGTEWGNEKLFVPGPTDEPWISETEEKLKKAEKERDEARGKMARMIVGKQFEDAERERKCTVAAERMDDAEFERLCVAHQDTPVSRSRAYALIAEARRARESEAGKFWSTVDGKVIGEQEAEIAALRTALKGVEREAVTYLEERNAAEARLSEIVKSLAAAVTKEKP
jgi:hypothetical protein